MTCGGEILQMSKMADTLSHVTIFSKWYFVSNIPTNDINHYPTGSRAVLQRQYSTTGRKPTSKIDESTTVDVSSTHVLLQGLLQSVSGFALDACAPQTYKAKSPSVCVEGCQKR